MGAMRQSDPVHRGRGHIARSWIAAVAAVAAGGLIASCAGEGEPSDAPAPEQAVASETVQTPAGATESDRAIAAYRAWLEAVENRDPQAACRRHAPQFTIELRQRAVEAKQARLGDPCVDVAHLLWDDPTRAYDPELVEVTGVTGERARLAVDFGGDAVDESVLLVNRRGTWLVADLTPRAEGARNGDRWVEHWCDLTLEMDRDRLIYEMGEPTGEYTVANGGEPQIFWTDRQYDFRAYLDTDGSVLDLVGDYDALDADDRRQLTCGELR